MSLENIRRERALKFLRGHDASRISFTINAKGRTITVDGTSFQRVADAIERGTVQLTVTTQMPLAGAGAVYYGTSGVADDGTPIPANSLFTTPLHGRLDEAYLIHESVHASLDLTRSAGIPRPYEETVAYLAEVLYYRRTGLSRSRVSEPIRVAALPVVESIIRTGRSEGPALVDLVHKISNHSLYSAGAKSCYIRNG